MRLYIILFLLHLGCALALGQTSRADSLIHSRQAPTLTLRCRAPQPQYAPPVYGMIEATSGSTVFIAGDQSIGSIRPHSSRPLNRGNEMSSGGELELRILGRNIFFNKTVDHLELIDITGQPILTQYNTRRTNLSDIRPGIYILRCSSGGRQSTNKFILR
ncbi:MAG: T9SS type A sorting domain-containing protein [Porphyromonadaceae bacterium]|nr:T9SS type A sorting domain-containing protein [Porphyromonadaceae bacterium]